MTEVSELNFYTLLLVASLIVFSLAMVLVAAAVWYQRKSDRHQLQLEQLRNQQQAAQLKAGLQAQEDERARIARDLHDELGAKLSTIKLYLTAPGNHSAPSKSQHKATSLLDTTIEQIRHIAHNLVPQNLAQLGLVRSLKSLFAECNQSGHLQVKFQYELSQSPKGNEALHLYRMVHELLNNTLKHAQASEVTIGLNQTDAEWILSYRDNGRGFDASLASTAQSLGIKTLHTRAALLGGNIAINTAPGNGFEAQVQVPVAAATPQSTAPSPTLNTSNV